MRGRRKKNTGRGQSPQPVVPAATMEPSQDSQTKIPSTVHEGGFFSWGFSKQARAKYLGQQAPGRDRQADLGKLTRAEKLVYPMLEAALTNKEIATKSGRSEQTAKTHVRHIIRKLGLKNRAALVRS